MSSPNRSERSALAAAGALLVALSMCGCGSTEGETRPAAAISGPHVVLVVIDTLRADHLSLYGYARPTSPRLDRLAAQSLVYDRAFTVMSHTLPAHVSLFTGVHPATHKVLSNGWRYDGDHPTLAERLREVGYETAAFVSGFPLTAESGLDRGFDVYEEATERGRKVPKIPGRTTNERAVEWLESRGGRPFFLFVHYFDTHVPYLSTPGAERPFEVDDGLAARLRALGADGLSIDDVSSVPVVLDGQPLTLPAAVNAYDNQIVIADSLVGELIDTLERLGFIDDSLIIVTSDHGEGLGQHRYFAHGLYLYEEQLRIPLIVQPPRDLAGSPGRVGSVVSLLDVVPTVLDGVGLAAEPWLHGRRLPLDVGEESTARWLVAQRRHFPQKTRQRRGPGFSADASLHALRGDGPLKYLRTGAGAEELYDLDADPGELHNLAGERRDDCTAMSALLAQLLAQSSVEGPIVEPDLDPETIKRLETLGYVQ